MTLKSWELGSGCTQNLLFHEEAPGRRAFPFIPPLMEQEMKPYETVNSQSPGWVKVRRSHSPWHPPRGDMARAHEIQLPNYCVKMGN